MELVAEARIERCWLARAEAREDGAEDRVGTALVESTRFSLNGVSMLRA